MFVIGLISASGLLFYDIINYNKKPDISGITIGFNGNINNTGDSLLLILDLIIRCIRNLGFLLVIYYYIPCHNFISEFISQFITYIIDAIQSQDDFYSLVNNILFFNWIFNQYMLYNYL